MNPNPNTRRRKKPRYWNSNFEKRPPRRRRRRSASDDWFVLVELPPVPIPEHSSSGSSRRSRRPRVSSRLAVRRGAGAGAGGSIRGRTLIVEGELRSASSFRGAASLSMARWQRLLGPVLRQASSKIEHLQRPFTQPYNGRFLHSSSMCDFQPSRDIYKASYRYLQSSGFFSSKHLMTEHESSMVPVSSPLTPGSPGFGESNKTDKKVSKALKVQAIKKDIRQSPKKVNLVAKLVRGMRVEDALIQLQLTVKRASKTVYQVIHSARANATHNHGLDADRLLVAEAFVGKGLYLKRISYHAKGRSGIMVRPHCRLTVVVRETTAEEEAKIAKLKVSNFKKLTRKERQLCPHKLIETTPIWGRKRKQAADAAASSSPL